MKIIDNITVYDEITLIGISNTSADIEHIARVFNMFAEADINVDMISQLPPGGANSGFSFTVGDSDFVKVLAICAELRKLNSEIKISVSSGNTKISVSGEAMRDLSGVAAKIFTAAAKANADVRMITTSETDVSLLVVSTDSESVVKSIENAFSE
ncbi:MAG: hypothetical protein II702_10745 [Clostridia bacterium]|jgi:aspartokinase|nr:hypothetical protein [Clostridia bacterium]MBQ4245377.1 hypothetical protein [Clostridia bacterium]